jgi:hypothetical protein
MARRKTISHSRPGGNAVFFSLQGATFGGARQNFFAAWPLGAFALKILA